MAKAKKRIRTNSTPWFRVKADTPTFSTKYSKGKSPVVKSDVFRGEEEYQEKSLPPELAALCRPRD